MFAHWESDSNMWHVNDETPQMLCLSWGPCTNTSITMDEENDVGGWLITSLSDGRIGISLTHITNKLTDFTRPISKSYNLPTYYHRCAVPLVKMNKAGSMLATSDITGKICLWKFRNAEWRHKSSINIEKSGATDLVWSNDGRFLVVCFPHGTISIVNITETTTTTIICSISIFKTNFNMYVGFSMDDQNLYIASDDGRVANVVLDNVDFIQPVAYCQYRQLHVGPIIQLISNHTNNTIAVVSENGEVFLILDFEDPIPRQIYTELSCKKLAWSNSGKYLAILGADWHGYIYLSICNHSGRLLFKFPKFRYLNAYNEPKLSVVWGHGDKRVFISTGNDVRVARVIVRQVLSLEELSCIRLLELVQHPDKISSFILPPSTLITLCLLQRSSIFSFLPTTDKSQEKFLLTPIVKNYGRMSCTVICNNSVYSLFMEYLGGFVPLLTAHQQGKLRLKFLIMDSETLGEKQFAIGQVKSNALGTKFRIHERKESKKNYIGKIHYKASVLRLMPRKMTIKIPNIKADQQSINKSKKSKSEKQLKIQNKMPRWNSTLQVYQLDCGERAIFESEKNCCFHYNGTQALQFGRIGENSFTLDFAYPFSPLQAFAIAISSLTHRLK